MLHSMVAKYKSEYYYWEYVLFIRRILIAMLSVTVNTNESNFLLIVVLVIFIVLQKKYKPFIVHSANEMEFLLLLFLVIVLSLNFSPSTDTAFNTFVLSVFILIPFPMFVYYVYRFLQKKDDDDGIESASKRMMRLKQQIKYLILCIICFYATPDNNQRAVLIDAEQEEENENSYHRAPAVEMTPNAYKD
eukprot:CAMPEP_0197027532 /NCGR_PEP_ID=MMETSP1384-20130603/7430_1 /TAXON_ID=29189 /ORGANISM="Ammonia sp." /LENGTH=189 /DNA_ID=CAMNT_0042456393 /DNA_START=188 /DNA_END=757 /DNA_ORIENTATION=-